MIKKFVQKFKYFNFLSRIGKNRYVKTYLSTTIVILITLLFIFLAIKPTIETILILQKKVNDSKEVVQKIEQKINDLNLAIENYGNLSEGIKNRINLALPSTVALKTITQSLEETAKVNGASISALQLQSFKVEPTHNGLTQNISEIEFTFNAEGSYSSIISILQSLKRSQRLITINALSLRNLDTQSSNLVMSITGKVYFIK